MEKGASRGTTLIGRQAAYHFFIFAQEKKTLSNTIGLEV